MKRKKWKKLLLLATIYVGLYAIAEMRRTKTKTFLLDTQRDYA